MRLTWLLSLHANDLIIQKYLNASKILVGVEGEANLMYMFFTIFSIEVDVLESLGRINKRFVQKGSA